MPYHLEGRLLEVCDCRVLCPCWIGEDPDNGTCDTIVAYHFDKGAIDGIDVSDTTIAIVAHLPGNILQGNWRVAVYIDERASAQQEAAILKVYTGQAGGPIADIAKLIGEVVAVERAPIRFDVRGGRGIISIGDSQYRRTRALPGRDRRPYDARRHDFLDRAGRAGLCRQGPALPVQAARAGDRPRPQGP